MPVTALAMREIERDASGRAFEVEHFLRGPPIDERLLLYAIVPLFLFGAGPLYGAAGILVDLLVLWWVWVPKYSIAEGLLRIDRPLRRRKVVALEDIVSIRLGERVHAPLSKGYVHQATVVRYRDAGRERKLGVHEGQFAGPDEWDRFLRRIALPTPRRR